MKITQIPRRFLSWLLVFSLVLGYVPISGRAAGHGRLCEHHMEHTADCGYIEGEYACGFLCEECAAAPIVTKSTQTPQCDCDTDSEDHATSCPCYTAPKNPVCTCAAKCEEANVWCDVCGFDASACKGEDEAAMYTQTYIARIAVAQNRNAGDIGRNAAKKELTDAGFTVLNKDLNAGTASISHIYMGYKTTTNYKDAITGIVFRQYSSPPDSITYNGATFYILGSTTEPNSGDGKVNLNDDTGDTSIYTYVTRDKNYGPPLTALTINTSSTPPSGYATACFTNGKIADLNATAGGDYIYLHYRTYSATVKVVFNYLTENGRVSVTKTKNLLNPDDAFTGGIEIPDDFFYDDIRWLVVGWRDDDEIASAEYSNSNIKVTLAQSGKVFNAVYTFPFAGLVRYNANGGSGLTGSNGFEDMYSVGLNAGTSSIKIEYGLAQLRHHPNLTHSGKCGFLGWSQNQNATKADYEDGGQYQFDKREVTLYAIWKDHADGNSDGFCDSCGQSVAQPSLTGGVYQISNKAELIWFMQEVNRGSKNINGKLTADINMSGYNWTPIAQTGLYYKTTTYNNPDTGYTGTFDGNGKVISNLKMTTSTSVEQTYGLFGTISGTVKNLGLTGVSYTFPSGAKDLRAGGIVGQMLPGSTVTDCYVVDSTINPGQYIVGGIAACNYGGTIANCYTKNVTIKANDRCGNLVSDTRGDINTSDRPGTVTNCYTDASRVVGTQTGNKVTGCEASVSAERFASGEIAYRLNGGKTSGQRWFQTCGSGLPAFSGSTVYQTTLCDNTTIIWRNDTEKPHTGSFVEGFCSGCGNVYEEPKLVDGYYQIYNAGQLYWFAEQVNSGSKSINGKLMDNIEVNKNVLNEDGTLNGDGTNFRAWTPIGNSKSVNYTGTFNGNGKTISGLYFNDATKYYIGLFGYVYGGKIQNLGLLDSYFCGNQYVGGVAGCVSSSGSVINSYNMGSVSGDYNIGGVTGALSSNSSVINSYNTGSVSGNQYVGGVAGYLFLKVSVINSYNTGTVSGNQYVGGVVGNIADSTITNCYYLTGTANRGIGDGDGEAIAKAEEEFASGEVAYLLGEAFGQNIDNGKTKQDYPVLSDATVYQNQSKACTAESYTISYSNTQKDAVTSHSFDKGFCSVCDAYEQPKLVDGYYQIYNAGQLYWFAEKVNSGSRSINGKLMDNIVVNKNVLSANGTPSRAWTPIGNFDNNYAGTFEGNDKTISGLYFNDNLKDYVGLFGYVSTKGKILNVGVVDSYFHGEMYVGGVAGVNEGTIRNCYNTGEIVGLSKVGGVVGCSYSGTISNCYNTGMVNGIWYVGGVAGYVSSSTVSNCYNAGQITDGARGGGMYIGGVVGYVFNGSIVSCYNTGSLHGIAGYGGGVAGDVENSTISNCYYLHWGYGVNTPGGIDGSDVEGQAEKKTIDQFKSGEVAYLLGEAFGQNLDNDETKQDYPVLSGAAVYEYQKLNCLDEAIGYGYSNTQKDAVTSHSKYDNGFCSVCDAYEQPKLVDGYYQIYNAGQLYWFAEQANSVNGSINGKLMDNIVVNKNVLNEKGKPNEGEFRIWTPIGIDWQKGYAGTFEGNGKTISGLYFNDAKKEYVGLFGSVDGGKIQNLGILDSYFCGKNYVSGVVGYVKDNSSVSNCYNTGSVSGTGDYVGGVVGYVEMGYVDSSTVSDCYNTGSISGDDYVGGVAGYVKNNSSVSNCYNTGSVSGTGDYVGGVAGKVQYSTISNCYNTGTVRGKYCVGGVTGCLYYSSVSNSHSIGRVSSDSSVGGVVGSATDNSTISNCYNTGTVSGTGSFVGGVTGRLCYSSISNSHSIGSVSGNRYVGGVVGDAYENYSGAVSNCYYLTGTASKGIGDGDGEATAKSKEEFASGEVAYLLQSGVEAVNGVIPEVWGQNIDNGETKQDYPVLSDATVYQNQSKACTAESYTISYSNTQKDAVTSHRFDNGFCSDCDLYEQPKLVDGYYQIYNAGQLYWFAEKVNSGSKSINGKLMDNIVVNKNVLNEDGELNDGEFRDWIPIGNYTSYIDNKNYTGTFEGNGKTISGLYFNDATKNYIGLFGYVYGGKIQNLGLLDSYFCGYYYVGGVVGYVDSSTVSNCYNTGSVSGDCDIGGVAGRISYGSTASNCCNIGGVTGDGEVGGVVGYTTFESTISNCYNTGAVTGDGYVGGVTGRLYYSSISNSHSIGSVSGNNYVGGVVGDTYYNDIGAVSNCYYLTGTAKRGIGSGDGEATAKSKEEFASGEVAYLLQSGVEAVNGVIPEVWGQTIGTEAFPVLGGEKVYAVANCQGNASGYSNTNEDSGVVHSYGKPAFNWAEDYTTCTAVFTCTLCTTAVEHTCDLSVETSDDGRQTFYTATVTYQNETYTDVQEVENVILSVNISWGDLSFTYTDGWDNPDAAWVQVENTGTETVSVTYTYETEREDIDGSFYDDVTTIKAPVAIDAESTKKIWLRLDGEPEEVLVNSRIGTVKLTIE